MGLFKMGGMIVQEIVKTSLQVPIPPNVPIIINLILATGSIGNIPDRFESLDVSIKRSLKEEGIKETVKRIPPK